MYNACTIMYIQSYQGRKTSNFISTFYESIYTYKKRKAVQDMGCIYRYKPTTWDVWSNVVVFSRATLWQFRVIYELTVECQEWPCPRASVTPITTILNDQLNSVRDMQNVGFLRYPYCIIYGETWILWIVINKVNNN